MTHWVAASLKTLQWEHGGKRAVERPTHWKVSFPTVFMTMPMFLAEVVYPGKVHSLIGGGGLFSHR